MLIYRPAPQASQTRRVSKPVGALSRRLFAAAIVLTVVAIGPSLGSAATDTWLGNTSVNWADNSNWDTAPATGDSLVFILAGTSGTTLNNNLAVDFSTAGITFNSGATAFTFNGNEITLAGNITNSSTSLETINLPMVTTVVRTITMTNAGGNVTLGGVISGAGGLTTGGIGTLTLNAANTYGGATTMVNTAGATPTILVLGNANSLQNSTLSTTTANNAFNTIRFASGIGTFNLGGLAGGTSNATTFALNDAANQPITLVVGGNNANTTYSGGFYGSGNVVKVGTGTWTLNQGSNDNNNANAMFNSLVGWTGNLTISAGTVVASAGNSALGLQRRNRTITVNNTSTQLNFTNINIFGSMANNDAPALVVNGGTVSSTRYNALGNLTLNGATLTQASTDTGTLRGYQFYGAVTVGGTAASTIATTNGSPNHLGPNTVFNVADATSSPAADLNVTTALSDQSSGFNNLPASFTKTGAGTMLLTGLNTYTGGAIISQGTLTITSSTAPASADTGNWAATGSAVVGGLVNGTGGLFIDEPVSGIGIPAGTRIRSIDKATQITLTANTTIAGTNAAISFSGGSGLGGGTAAVTVIASGATLDASGAPGGLTLFSNRRVINNGTVVGAVTLPAGTIQGTGSYTGTTSLSGTGAIAPGNTTTTGTVTLGNLTASGGTLAIKASGGTSDVVNVTGTATFTGGSVSMLLGPTAPTSLTYNVVTSGNAITGTPGAGSGALGRATYTVINTGNSIQVQFSAKPAANLTWTSGTTNWDNVQTDANWTTADSGIADTTHFYDGDYVTFSNNSGGTVNFNTNVAPTIATVGGTGNYTFASAGSSGLTGAGTLVKTGSGSLTLNNTNTHTGGIMLNQGTLNVNTAGALGAGPLTINGGTLDNTSGPALTLTTNNAQVWAGSFTFAGTGDLTLGTGAVTLNGNPTLTVNGNLIVGGAISDGTGNGYTKAGAGTLVLTGRSLFTGAFNITDGVVKAGIGQLGGSVFGSTAGPTNISGNGTVDIANQALNTVEQFNIQGDGFSGQGAIVNNGVSTSPGLGSTSAQISRVTLTGDASVGGIVRWDLRGNDPQIDLAGHTLNKVGGNFVDLVSTQVRSTGGPGVLRVMSGTLGIEANSSLNSAVSTGSVVVESGGNLNFWSTSGIVNWPITFKGSNDFGNGDTGTSVVASNITLAGPGITIYPRAGGAGPLPPLPGDRVTDLNTGTNFGTFTLSGSLGESGGSFGLTKEQNGTLILAGNNTFTGGLTINGGTVQLNSPGALNSTTPNAVTINGNSGTNANVLPRLRLNGNSVTVGGLNSTGGGFSTMKPTVENNNATSATLTVMVGTNPTFDGILQNGAAAGSLSVAITGSGTFTLTGANTYTGSTTIGTGGTLQVGNGGATGSIAATTAISGGAGATLGFNTTTNTTVSAPITGGLALNKDNSNRLTLSAANTFSGATNVNAGTLSVTGSLSGSVNIFGLATLAGTGSVGSVVSSGILSPGLSAGTLTMSTLNVTGGDYKVDVGSGASGDLISVAGLAHYTGPSTITPQGAAPAAGTYTILSAGTLTIGTTPTLVLVPQTRFSLSLVTNPGANGTIQLTQTGTAAALIWKGNVNTGGNFVWDLNTTANWLNSGNNQADKFFNGDNVTFDDTGVNKTVTINASVQPNSITVSNSTGNDYTFTGLADVTGTTGITKTGTGALTISNTNTYSGITTVNQGTLNANATNALGVGTVTVNGGTLNATISDALGTGGSAIIVNGGALNANASNTLRTGALTLNGGTLNLGDAAAMGTGTLTFNGGTLDNTIGSAAILSTNNAQVWGGSFSFAGSNVDNTHDLNLGTGAVTLNGTPVITVAGSASTVTVDGVIADGTGNSLTKAGPGTLTLRVANSFTGALNVVGGTLTAGAAGIFGTTAGPTNISGGGMLDINNQTLNTTEQFNIQGTGVSGQGAIANNGAGTTGAQISRVTLTGDASIGGASRWDFRGNGPILDLAGHTLTKVGTNMISLVGITIRSTGGPGVIDVASGVLSIEAASTADLAANTGSFIFENGAGANFWNVAGTVNWPVTFKGNNNFGNGDTNASTLASPITLAGPGITLMPLSGGIPGGQPLPAVNSQLTLTGRIGESGGSFGLTKEGVGTVTLSGNNTFTGGLTINGGTVQLGAANRLADTSRLALGGGTFATGGFSDKLGTLAVTGTGGTIDLGAGASLLKFDPSSVVAWDGGSALTIGNWSNGLDRVFVGSDATGLTSTQLSQITFTGFSPGAAILSTGEIYPTGTPPTFIRGDWDRNGVVSTADILTMLTALTDLSTYKAKFNVLTNQELLSIGDFDSSGTITNKDIQPELDLIAGLPGGGRAAAVPEPATLVLLAIGLIAGCLIAPRYNRVLLEGEPNYVQHAGQQV